MSNRLMRIGFVVMVGSWSLGATPVWAEDAQGNTPQVQDGQSQSEPAAQIAQQEQAPSPVVGEASASKDTAAPGEPMAESGAASDATASSSAAPSTPPAAAEETAAASQPTETGLISVDFKDADIRQVLRILSLKSGVDIVAGADVEGLVTIKLTNVPWEQALDIILRTYGLAYERKGNVVRVLTLAAVESEALSTEVFPLNYGKAKEVTDVIKEMLTDRGKVKFDERTNTVIVTDLPSSLFQLKQVIERLDQTTPQVHIDTKIVETTLTKTDNFGIDWFNSVSLTTTGAKIPTTFPFPGGASFGNFGEELIPKPGDLSPSTGASISEGKIPQTGGTFTFGTLDSGSFNMTINMIASRANTNVISHPTIVTLNNIEAKVQVGEDINIPSFQIDSSTGKATVTGVSPRSTGVILKVTPHVNVQRDIVLDLAPEITSVKTNFDDFGNGIKFPRFTVQKATTQVRLKDGQTLVIGGLVKRQLTRTTDKVPFLGDIPIIGLLFTNRNTVDDPHQDLLIFLTVNLVEEEPIHEATVAQSVH